MLTGTGSRLQFAALLLVQLLDAARKLSAQALNIAIGVDIRSDALQPRLQIAPESSGPSRVAPEGNDPVL